jgi:hypothetical protein
VNQKKLAATAVLKWEASDDGGTAGERKTSRSDLENVPEVGLCSQHNPLKILVPLA